MEIRSRLGALAHHRRIGQFVSVGAVGAAIETAIVAVLTTVAGLGPLAAKAIGAEASISTMFVVNDRWTFANEGEQRPKPFVHRWLKSHVVRIVGLSIAFGVLYILTSIIEFELLLRGVDFWPTVANLVGIGAAMSVNYIAESLVTWEVHR